MRIVVFGSLFSHLSKPQMYVMPPKQVQEREKKDPDNIHEVPIQAGHLDRAKVFSRECALECHPEEPRHHAEPNDHVQGMKARHHKINVKEDTDLIAELILVEDKRTRRRRIR